MCRKKGKVIIVGDVALNIKREELYRKEIDLLISTSYGPGRYDEKYERKGLEYPYPYVRWTENRNMEAYLELISQKKINISTLIGETYFAADALKAYADFSFIPPITLSLFISSYIIFPGRTLSGQKAR